MCKILRNRWTGNVIYFDRKQTNTGTLIAERKIDPFFGNRNAFHLRIDVHIGVLIEPSFAGRNPGYIFTKMEEETNKYLAIAAYSIIILESIDQSICYLPINL